MIELLALAVLYGFFGWPGVAVGIICLAVASGGKKA